MNPFEIYRDMNLDLIWRRNKYTRGLLIEITRENKNGLYHS